MIAFGRNSEGLLLADLEPCTPGRQTTVFEFEVDILWGIVLQNSRPGNH